MNDKEKLKSLIKIILGLMLVIAFYAQYDVGTGRQSPNSNILMMLIFGVLCIVASFILLALNNIKRKIIFKYLASLFAGLFFISFFCMFSSILVGDIYGIKWVIFGRYPFFLACLIWMVLWFHWTIKRKF